MIVRYHGDPATVRAGVERAWKQITPDVPFNAEFSEDIIAELYEAEDARAKIFAAFALLAVIIGCLGLFGLAAFTAERRTKEIGIRKVLGARTRDIVRLLVWQFSRPVIIANIIAWPVAWWLMRDWLNGFDARIALAPVPFLIAGVLALLIAIVTVGGHAIRSRPRQPDPRAALRIAGNWWRIGRIWPVLRPFRDFNAHKNQLFVSPSELPDGSVVQTPADLCVRRRVGTGPGT